MSRPAAATDSRAAWVAEPTTSSSVSSEALAPAANSKWSGWLLVVAVWTGYGLVSAVEQHASYALSRGISLLWSVSLTTQLGLAAAWCLATPGIVWLGRRFPPERGRWWSSLPVHLTAALLLAVILNFGYAWLAYPLLPAQPNAPPATTRALQLLAGWLLADTVVYAAILCVSTLIQQQRRLRARDLAAAQLETQLTRAELQALQMQLQPHFVFNALHTVGALVRTNNQAGAIQVLTGLGDLLRRVLDRAATQEVPLRQELDFARTYLDIEQIRFRDRLTIEVLAGPEIQDAAVPHLILQPLVENAIRHGVAPTPGACTVRVSAERMGDRLHLTVSDDGTGTDNGRPDIGIGLANTRARLTRLYGRDGHLVFDVSAPRGHAVRVSLPYRMSSGVGASQ
jgi:two-component sensor histidine kinase